MADTKCTQWTTLTWQTSFWVSAISSVSKDQTPGVKIEDTRTAPSPRQGWLQCQCIQLFTWFSQWRRLVPFQTLLSSRWKSETKVSVIEQSMLALKDRRLPSHARTFTSWSSNICVSAEDFLLLCKWPLAPSSHRTTFHKNIWIGYCHYTQRTTHWFLYQFFRNSNITDKVTSLCSTESI